MSIFRTPASSRAHRDNGSVTPMTGHEGSPINPLTDSPHVKTEVPVQLPPIRHAPNAAPSKTRG